VTRFVYRDTILLAGSMLFWVFNRDTILSNRDTFSG